MLNSDIAIPFLVDSYERPSSAEPLKLLKQTESAEIIKAPDSEFKFLKNIQKNSQIENMSTQNIKGRYSNNSDE